MKNTAGIILICVASAFACRKKDSPDQPVAAVEFNVKAVSVNGNSTTPFQHLGLKPTLKIGFSSRVNASSVAGNVLFNRSSGQAVDFNTALENNDSVLVISPGANLVPFSSYNVTVSAALKSRENKSLPATVTYTISTGIDSSLKFPVIPDTALLTLVQRQTFKYFWDFGHPVSGLARERNSSGDLVTSGGSGFGIMAIPVAISRAFITRQEGLIRMQKIVAFLKNTAQTFRGAYPHWLNGVTGTVIPFSARDNGADLVETSYLLEGLLTARQYFNGADAAESSLRADINLIWNRVEWSWFRQNNQNTLYWHWNQSNGFEINMQVKGWNEALITYVLAASSSSYSVPKTVYDNGWATGPTFLNGNTYYGYRLPLGPPLGGPLFFEHYSFMGINPNGLSDAYADYAVQTRNHTLINYNYCAGNPRNYYGYSTACWGLTASDVQNGYAANSPTEDIGTISPTAALSSFPYTPAESMNALRFFYYVLGDRIFKDYGFTDAFSLSSAWFADSFLAIDQGPIIVMIENYRTGLAWNLFTSCPEVKAGMRKLGFTAPYL